MKKQKRMTAHLPIFLYLSAVIILELISIFFWVRDGREILGIGHFTSTLACCFLACIFLFPNKIFINDDRIIILNHPLFSTNSYYLGNKELIAWNNIINFSEIDNVELVNLTPDERKEYYGTKTLLNQFLKIDIKGSDKSKFIYISIYSKKQMDELIEIINSKISSKTSSIE